MKTVLTQVVNTYYQPEGREAVRISSSFSKEVPQEEDHISRTFLLHQGETKKVDKAWLEKVSFLTLYNQGLILTENPDYETQELIKTSYVLVSAGDLPLLHLGYGMSITLPITTEALETISLQSRYLDVYIQYVLFPG